MAELVWSCSCCVRLKSSPEETEQRSRSRQIDKLLEKDKHQYKRQVKILLLGAGESGKSTFIKQMKIIHGLHFDEELLREYRTIIYQNVVLGMKVLVDARNKLGIGWESNRYSQEQGQQQQLDGGQVVENENEEAEEEKKKAVERLKENAEKILRFDNQKTKDLWDTQLFLDYVPIVRELWQDSGIRKAFDRRREFQLPDSVKYFLDNINRIGTMRYVPSNQDILHARRATKGISELTILIRGIPFLFVDVGGQRSQRQKWFQCFDSITSILFLVSSSEFDQVIIEDRCTNRLIESMNIFETIVNNRCFGEVSVILFLNKTDLLEQKLKRKDTDISKHFPNFAGNPHNLINVQEFIKSMFDDVRRDRRRPLFCHFTTAVDTENIKVVFNAVRDTILSNNLKQLMLQ